MISKEAKLVFKGKVFEVHQWEQELYDGSHETFEGLKRDDTVAVIAAVGDKLILLSELQPHRKHPFTCLPGGRVDSGENPDDAVKREFLEETGYASEDWELYRKWRPSGKIDWNIHVYIARDCKKVSDQSLDPGENISVNLFSLDEFLDKVDADDFRNFEIRVDFVRAKYHAESRRKLEELLFKK